MKSIIIMTQKAAIALTTHPDEWVEPSHIHREFHNDTIARRKVIEEISPYYYNVRINILNVFSLSCSRLVRYSECWTTC